jgi:two-component system sensor histidine kinase VicK
MADQLKETLDELKREEKVRREFVANVSHDLRTPVTSIRGYAETLIEMPDIEDESRVKFLNIILNESDRMTKIVKDLLELTGYDAGSMSIVPARFSIEQSVRGLYDAMVIQAEHRKQRMTLELSEGMPEIYGDRARIEQALMNIMTNAVKYTPDGGIIRITSGVSRSGRDGEFVWVKISDTGAGIPEEDIPKIFDRFYTVQKARTRKESGTGLGLSIVREIITRHGGSVDGESV